MRKKLKEIVSRLWGRFCGFLLSLLILGYLVMSKKNQRRKRRQNQQQTQEDKKNKKAAKAALREAKRAAKAAQNDTNVSSKGRREPIGVGEIIKHSSNSDMSIAGKLNFENCFPNRNYKVIQKPAFFVGEFNFIGQIGWCVATIREKGAKLKFSSGEIAYIGFDALELVEDKMKETTMEIQTPLPLMKTVEVPPLTVTDKTKVVTTDNAKKGAQYKVIKKPDRWRTPCKFLGHVGVCVLIDDRGIRLRFSEGDDISFEPECLEEAESMDLNTVSEITEATVGIGEIFRIIKRPSHFGNDAENLVGKVGKAKWASYNGVCIKFEDSSGYVIPYDCLDRVVEIPKSRPNPVNPAEKLNASNIVIGRKYKFIKIPSGWGGDRDLLGEMGIVKWASDVSKGARMIFHNKSEYTIPFDCIGDLPRPDDSELLLLIHKHPERILRMIKALNKITKLLPVRTFIETGELPRRVATETLGPPVPTCVVEEPSSDEESETNRVLALIGPIKPSEPGNPS